MTTIELLPLLSYVLISSFTPGPSNIASRQVSNPKLVVYALTLFSSFLAPIAGNPALLVVAALLLAAVSACATSVWAMFGAGIKARLRSPRVARWVNAALALCLVYAAIDLAGPRLVP